jgi:hypothetical protein
MELEMEIGILIIRDNNSNNIIYLSGCGSYDDNGNKIGSWIEVDEKINEYVVYIKFSENIIIY